jgi:Rrf2 family protein
MLNKRADYGTRILYELAVEPERFHSARKLADQHHVPEAFLRKILQDLRRVGIVTAQKGRTGGYRLARSPAAVTVGEVLDALAGPLPGVAYLWGEGRLIEENSPTAPLWRHLEKRLAQELGRISLADVVELAHKGPKG